MILEMIQVQNTKEISVCLIGTIGFLMVSVMGWVPTDSNFFAETF